MLFKKYKSKKNEDGSYDILGVPIFNLGTHKGYKFTKEWFKKTQQVHKDLEEKDGYLPSLIIGHNNKEDEEKPAKGFFRNLKLKGDTILADLVKIPATMFEIIKERAYPHRSVEVYPKDNRFTALALLGGTTPYHKLPILEIFKEMGNKDENDKQILSFYLNETNDLVWDKSIEEEANQDEQLSKIRRIWSIISDRMYNIFSSLTDMKELSKKSNEVLDEGKKALNKELKTTKLNEEESNMDPTKFTEEQKKETQKKYREDFKAKYGDYPEELVRKQKEESIKTFCENLKTSNVIPAVVDELIAPFLNGMSENKVTFAEKELSTEEAAREMINNLVKYAQDGKLFVDTSEHTEHGSNSDIPTEFDDQDDVDAEELKYHKKAIALVREKKISYEEAINIIMDGGK